MHTKASLLQELRALLPSNATVLMHSSCKSLGPMENGADTLLDALTEHFSDGLVGAADAHLGHRGQAPARL